jgi:cob(I)alamin adenosyltransferase
MPNRLTRIYTRTGDDGSTGLAGGGRLGKDSPRIEAIGSIDELNSLLGLLLSDELPADVRAALSPIQHRLFDLGGELAMPDTQLMRDAWVTQLEQQLDQFNSRLPALQNFVLPGGNRPAAHCHVARSACRRAERELLRLSRDEQVNSASLKYLNRLSDLLFVVARVLARQDGGQEILWQPSSD